jgi:hypothetical protein
MLYIIRNHFSLESSSYITYKKTFKYYDSRFFSISTYKEEYDVCDDKTRTEGFILRYGSFPLYRYESPVHFYHRTSDLAFNNCLGDEVLAPLIEKIKAKHPQFPYVMGSMEGSDPFPITFLFNLTEQEKRELPVFLCEICEGDPIKILSIYSYYMNEFYSEWLDYLGYTDIVWSSELNLLYVDRRQRILEYRMFISNVDVSVFIVPEPSLIALWRADLSEVICPRLSGISTLSRYV